MNCEICNTEFESKSRLHKFCSRKCSSKSSTLKRSKKPNEKTCKMCSVVFTPYTSLDKFCSANCRVENMKSKRSRRWSEEASKKRIGDKNPCFRNGMYQRSNTKTSVGQKEFMRIRDKIRADMILDYGFLFCEKCKTTNTYQWEMHHVIFRSEKPLHPNLHDKRNLINLCIPCHNWFHKVKSNRNALVEERKLYELFGEDVRNK